MYATFTPLGMFKQEMGILYVFGKTLNGYNQEWYNFLVVISSLGTNRLFTYPNLSQANTKASEYWSEIYCIW